MFEVYLRSLGREPIRIHHIPENESTLTLAVPWSVAPGEYRVEVRWRKPIPLAWSKTLVEYQNKLVVKNNTSPLPPPCPDDPIVFAGLDWPSVQMQNAIALFILKYGYDCKVDLIEGSAIPLFKSLVNGNLHVFMELWLPNYQEEWKEAIRQGSIIPLGRSLDDQWQSTFVVPTYVIKGDPGRGTQPMAPELKSPQDILEYQMVFAIQSSDGKAVLTNCIEGWNCKDINHQKVEAYGLGDVIKLEVPVSADALLKSLEDSYQRGRPG